MTPGSSVAVAVGVAVGGRLVPVGLGVRVGVTVAVLVGSKGVPVGLGCGSVWPYWSAVGWYLSDWACA